MASDYDFFLKFGSDATTFAKQLKQDLAPVRAEIVSLQRALYGLASVSAKQGGAAAAALAAAGASGGGGGSGTTASASLDFERFDRQLSVIISKQAELTGSMTNWQTTVQREINNVLDALNEAASTLQGVSKSIGPLADEIRQARANAGKSTTRTDQYYDRENPDALYIKNRDRARRKAEREGREFDEEAFRRRSIAQRQARDERRYADGEPARPQRIADTPTAAIDAAELKKLVDAISSSNSPKVVEAINRSTDATKRVEEAVNRLRRGRGGSAIADAPTDDSGSGSALKQRKGRRRPTKTAQNIAEQVEVDLTDAVVEVMENDAPKKGRRRRGKQAYKKAAQEAAIKLGDDASNLAELPLSPDFEARASSRGKNAYTRQDLVKILQALGVSADAIPSEGPKAPLVQDAIRLAKARADAGDVIAPETEQSKALAKKLTGNIRGMLTDLVIISQETAEETAARKLTTQDIRSGGQRREISDMRTTFGTGSKIPTDAIERNIDALDALAKAQAEAFKDFAAGKIPTLDETEAERLRRQQEAAYAALQRGSVQGVPEQNAKGRYQFGAIYGGQSAADEYMADKSGRARSIAAQRAEEQKNRVFAVSGSGEAQAAGKGESQINAAWRVLEQRAERVGETFMSTALQLLTENPAFDPYALEGSLRGKDDGKARAAARKLQEAFEAIDQLINAVDNLPELHGNDIVSIDRMREGQNVPVYFKQSDLSAGADARAKSKEDAERKREARDEFRRALREVRAADADARFGLNTGLGSGRTTQNVSALLPGVRRVGNKLFPTEEPGVTLDGRQLPNRTPEDLKPLTQRWKDVIKLEKQIIKIGLAMQELEEGTDAYILAQQKMAKKNKQLADKETLLYNAYDAAFYPNGGRLPTADTKNPETGEIIRREYSLRQQAKATADSKAASDEQRKGVLEDRRDDRAMGRNLTPLVDVIDKVLAIPENPDIVARREQLTSTPNLTDQQRAAQGMKPDLIRIFAQQVGEAEKRVAKFDDSVEGVIRALDRDGNELSRMTIGMRDGRMQMHTDETDPGLISKFRKIGLAQAAMAGVEAQLKGNIAYGLDMTSVPYAPGTTVHSDYRKIKDGSFLATRGIVSDFGMSEVEEQRYKAAYGRETGADGQQYLKIKLAGDAIGRILQDIAQELNTHADSLSTGDQESVRQGLQGKLEKQMIDLAAGQLAKAGIQWDEHTNPSLAQQTTFQGLIDELRRLFKTPTGPMISEYDPTWTPPNQGVNPQTMGPHGVKTKLPDGREVYALPQDEPKPIQERPSLRVIGTAREVYGMDGSFAGPSYLGRTSGSAPKAESQATAAAAMQEKAAVQSTEAAQAQTEAAAAVKQMKSGGDFEKCCDRMIAALNRINETLRSGLLIKGEGVAKPVKDAGAVDDVQARANSGIPRKPADRRQRFSDANRRELYEAASDETKAAVAANDKLAIALSLVNKEQLKIKDAAAVVSDQFKDNVEEAKALERAVRDTLTNDELIKKTRGLKRAQGEKDSGPTAADARAAGLLAQTLGKVSAETRDAAREARQLKDSEADVTRVVQAQARAYVLLQRELDKMGYSGNARKNQIKQILGVSDKEYRDIARTSESLVGGGGKKPPTNNNSMNDAADGGGKQFGNRMAYTAQNAFDATFFGNHGFWSRVLNSTGTFIVRNFSAGFVFGITNALQDAVSQAIETESTFVRVSEALNDTGRSTANVRQGLSQLSQEYGVALKDVYTTAAGLTGLFDESDAGNKGLLALTKVATQLQLISGGALNATEAMRSLASVTSAYGEQGFQQGQKTQVVNAQEIADILTTIQNQLGVNIEESVEGVARLAGQAKELGIEFANVATYAAAISKFTGQTGAASGEQLSRILASLQSSRTQAVLTNAFGQNLGNTLRSRDFDSSLKIILSGYKQLNDAEKNRVAVAIGGQRQAAAVNALLIEGAKVLDVASEASQSNGAANKRASEISGQLAAQIERAKTAFVNFIAALVQSGALNSIQVILGAILNLLGLINSALTGLNEVASQNKVLSVFQSVITTGAGFLLLVKGLDIAWKNFAGTLRQVEVAAKAAMAAQAGADAAQAAGSVGGLASLIRGGFSRQGNIYGRAAGRLESGAESIAARAAARRALRDSAEEPVRQGAGFGTRRVFAVGESGEAIEKTTAKLTRLDKASEVAGKGLGKLSGAMDAMAAAPVASTLAIIGLTIAIAGLAKAGADADAFGQRLKDLADQLNNVNEAADGESTSTPNALQAALGRNAEGNFDGPGGLISGTWTFLQTFLEQNAKRAMQGQTGIEQIVGGFGDAKDSLNGTLPKYNDAFNKAQGDVAKAIADAQANAQSSEEVKATAAQVTKIYADLATEINNDPLVTDIQRGGAAEQIKAANAQASQALQEIGLAKAGFKETDLLSIDVIQNAGDLIASYGNLGNEAKKAAQTYIKNRIKSLNLAPDDTLNTTLSEIVAPVGASNKFETKKPRIKYGKPEAKFATQVTNKTRLEAVNKYYTDITDRIQAQIDGLDEGDERLPELTKAYDNAVKERDAALRSILEQESTAAQILADQARRHGDMNALTTAVKAQVEAIKNKRDNGFLTAIEAQEQIQLLMNNLAQTKIDNALQQLRALASRNPGKASKQSDKILLQAVNLALSTDDVSILISVINNATKAQMALVEKAVNDAIILAARTNDLAGLKKALADKANLELAKLSWTPAKVDYGLDAVQDAADKAHDAEVARRNAQIASIDPTRAVAIARARLAAARAEQSYAARKFGKNSAEYWNAVAGVIEAQRGVEDALQQVIEANSNLAIAYAEASGNTVKAAYLRLQEARRKLAKAKKDGGTGTADYKNAKADEVAANAAYRDAKLQDALDTINFNKEMGYATAQETIKALQELLKLKNLTKEQRRQIKLQIKGLQDEINSQFEGQWNIGDSIKIPTPYEMRRVLGVEAWRKQMEDMRKEVSPTGGLSGGIGAQTNDLATAIDQLATAIAVKSTTYISEDNRSIEVNGTDIGMVKKIIQDTLGTSTSSRSGTGTRR